MVNKKPRKANVYKKPKNKTVFSREQKLITYKVKEKM